MSRVRPIRAWGMSLPIVSMCSGLAANQNLVPGRRDCYVASYADEHARCEAPQV